jgi:hypothetical protein
MVFICVHFLCLPLGPDFKGAKKTNQHYWQPKLNVFGSYKYIWPPIPSAVSYADKRKGCRSLGSTASNCPAPCNQEWATSESRFTPPSRLSILDCTARLRDMAPPQKKEGVTPFCAAKYRSCCRNKTVKLFESAVCRRVFYRPGNSEKRRVAQRAGTVGVPFLCSFLHPDGSQILQGIKASCQSSAFSVC